VTQRSKLQSDVYVIYASPDMQQGAHKRGNTGSCFNDKAVLHVSVMMRHSPVD